MLFKSFEEFWAEFLQITFHLENPDRWPSRERKASWLQFHLAVEAGGSVLDIGCGDGLIDIWLSRSQLNVTAVDLNSSTLNFARADDDTKRVQFIQRDFRKLSFQPNSFAAAFFIESVGLVKKAEDMALFQHIHHWLRPLGKFMIDCPETAETSNAWSKKFQDGEVFGESSFNPESLIQKIDFKFIPTEGQVFGLKDPLDSQTSGIQRYIYPKEELTAMLHSVGFVVEEVPHYYRSGYYGLKCTKRASSAIADDAV
jgi:cyclopropane fatty-acyl-phospholipid synthase-like methyltransferase